eukprot:m51a1_g1974 putative domain-containing protein (1075) ;mRNA; r:1105937-1109935
MSSKPPAGAPPSGCCWPCWRLSSHSSPSASARDWGSSRAQSEVSVTAGPPPRVQLSDSQTGERVAGGDGEEVAVLRLEDSSRYFVLRCPQRGLAVGVGFHTREAAAAFAAAVTPSGSPLAVYSSPSKSAQKHGGHSHHKRESSAKKQRSSSREPTGPSLGSLLSSIASDGELSAPRSRSSSRAASEAHTPRKATAEGGGADAAATPMKAADRAQPPDYSPCSPMPLAVALARISAEKLEPVATAGPKQQAAAKSPRTEGNAAATATATAVPPIVAPAKSRTPPPAAAGERKSPRKEDGAGQAAARQAPAEPNAARGQGDSPRSAQNAGQVAPPLPRDIEPASPAQQRELQKPATADAAARLVHPALAVAASSEPKRSSAPVVSSPRKLAGPPAAGSDGADAAATLARQVAELSTSLLAARTGMAEMEQRYREEEQQREEEIEALRSELTWYREHAESVHKASIEEAVRAAAQLQSALKELSERTLKLPAPVSVPTTPRKPALVVAPRTPVTGRARATTLKTASLGGGEERQRRVMMAEQQQQQPQHQISSISAAKIEEIRCASSVSLPAPSAHGRERSRSSIVAYNPLSVQEAASVGEIEGIGEYLHWRDSEVAARSRFQVLRELHELQLSSPRQERHRAKQHLSKWISKRPKPPQLVAIKALQTASLDKFVRTPPMRTLSVPEQATEEPGTAASAQTPQEERGQELGGASPDELSAILECHVDPECFGQFRVEQGGGGFSCSDRLELEQQSSYQTPYASELSQKKHYNIVAKLPTTPVIISLAAEPDAQTRCYTAIVRTKDDNRVLYLDESWVATGKGLRGIVGTLVAAEPSLARTQLSLVDGREIVADLSVMEERSVVRKVKFGVVYARQGQRDENALFSNTEPSAEFDEFLGLLGERVRLKGWKRFAANLDTLCDTTGEESVFREFAGLEIMYHVSTMIPFSESDPQQINRKSKIGNDIVVIVFKEGNTPFPPQCMTSHFNHVFVIVSCLDASHYTISIATKRGMRPFGPDLPDPPVFPKTKAFANFLLTKLLNAEQAALHSPPFSDLRTRTRQQLLEDMIRKYSKIAKPV